MKEMRDEETREFILHNKFGVLSLSDDARAYGLPIYYGYDGEKLYFHTHPGLKQRYIVRTREACFTIVRVQTLDDWASVQVFGDLERLQGGLGAMEALMSVPLPPDWGESAHNEPQRNDDDLIIYALTPSRITGRYSEHAPESREEREIAFGGM